LSDLACSAELLGIALRSSQDARCLATPEDRYPCIRPDPGIREIGWLTPGGMQSRALPGEYIQSPSNIVEGSSRAIRMRDGSRTRTLSLWRRVLYQLRYAHENPCVPKQRQGPCS